MKPRAQVNWKLLGRALGCALGLAAVVYLLHAVQLRRTAGVLLREAIRSEEQGRPDEAAKYLGFYLTHRPEDGDAWARYGTALERVASPAARAGALAAFEQALKRRPGRHDVRRRLVRLALEQGRYADAQAHALTLLQTFPRDGELEAAVGRCKEANREYAGAAEWFDRAARDRPGDVDSHARLADVLRRRLDRPGEADEVMDRLVAANADSFEAHLVRGRYRKEFASLEAAAEDVEHSRGLAPDEAAVLLASAELNRLRGRLAEARANLRRGLERHPREEAFYRELAALEDQAGRRHEAVACLRRGLEALPERPALLFSLAQLLVEVNDPEEAAAVITRLERAGGGPSGVQVLQAQLLARQGRLIEAARLLEQVRGRGGMPFEFLADVDLLLGRVYGELGDEERQLAVYRRGLALYPQAARLRLALGAALLGLGRADEALGELWQVMARPDAPPYGWLPLARALIQHNLHLPARERNWREVEQVLERAGQGLPDSAEVVVLGAELWAARGEFERARGVLQEARRRAPQQVEFYTAEVGLAGGHGGWEDALRALGEAQERLGDTVELRVARARVWTRRGTPEARERLAELEQGLEKFSPEEQARLLKGLGEAYAVTNDMRGAARLWAQAAERRPHDLGTRMQLFDLALRAEDADALERLAGEMRRIEGDGGSYWRYARAVCLYRQGKHGDRVALGAARRELAEAAARRPGWSRLALLEANLDEAAGEPRRALDGYLRAIELGDRQPAVVRRAVQLLYAHGRGPQADQLIEKVRQ
jgi:cellulose synthase operon protein C